MGLREIVFDHVCLQEEGKSSHDRRIMFDPLALLLDASLEGELDLVRKTAGQVEDPSAANDEGITALHNAICAGHIDIVQFLVTFGCDVNAQVCTNQAYLNKAAKQDDSDKLRILPLDVATPLKLLSQFNATDYQEDSMEIGDRAFL